MCQCVMLNILNKHFTITSVKLNLSEMRLISIADVCVNPGLMCCDMLVGVYKSLLSTKERIIITKIQVQVIFISWPKAQLYKYVCHKSSR